MFSFDDVIMINKFISEKSAMLIDPSFLFFVVFFSLLLLFAKFYNEKLVKDPQYGSHE